MNQCQSNSIYDMKQNFINILSDFSSVVSSLRKQMNVHVSFSSCKMFCFFCLQDQEHTVFAMKQKQNSQFAPKYYVSLLVLNEMSRQRFPCSHNTTWYRLLVWTTASRVPRYSLQEMDEVRVAESSKAPQFSAFRARKI